MHTNSLAREKSPYLLQHAHNPVDWYPWGSAAFEKAKKENKPIFLSVGYSTCHWCHVMERESFENEEIAAILNKDVVSIKVDRDERPDVDRIYMTYVQATTGGGGWPMSVWLTPDLKPFVGGTYFPPDDRYGRPGFGAVLKRIAEAWRQDQKSIAESSHSAIEQLKKHAEGGGPAGAVLNKDILDSAFFVFRRSFDTRRGGFGGAPKFPRPVVHNFLLRYHARTKNREAVDMVVATLKAMAKGGMHDQLGGGFHRYSVDDRWFVPHFEKMLYDQAQLAVAYIEAFQITGDRFHSGAARKIFEYVLRDMTEAGGGFYSAEDADSVIDPANPKEKGEGAFYIWTEAEIEKLLGQPAARYAAHYFGVEKDGNVREDPHKEFTGKNILYEAHTIEETAAHFDKPVEEVSASIESSKAKLLAERSKRVRPHLDDKVLTAWNGLMISALAKGGAALGERRYAGAARRAADFVLSRMVDAKSGELLRRYRDGDAAIPGFLDDYAFFVQALLDLYETDFDLRYLAQAIRLTEKQMALFEDKKNGGFFSTREGDASLVMRVKDDYDGAEPSGNSVAASNLLRLAQMTNREDFRTGAEKLLRSFSGALAAAPVGVPLLLAAYEFSLSKPKQIVLAGDRSSPDMRRLLSELHARFLPNRIVLMLDSDTARSTLSKFLPVLTNMTELRGKPTAYVCEDYACKLPTADAAKFAELLQ
ncbi:MAG: thioredoxin domain-containing protein [Bryobacteraceae bacterium]